MRTSFVSILMIIKFLTLVKSDVVDLSEKNYKEFTNNSKYFITICSDKMPKCKTLRNTLREISNKSVSEFGQSIKVGFLNFEKYPQLAKNWILEGFPTVYFVEDKEKEVYLGTKDFGGFMKYLKKKYSQNLVELENEDKLKDLMKKQNILNAAVFVGTPSKSSFKLDFISRAANLAGFNTLYIINNSNLLNKLEILNFDVAIYNSVKSNWLKLDLEDDDDLTLTQLKRKFLINTRNIQGYFQSINPIDFELSLNLNVPTLFYLYDTKEKINPQIEYDLQELAKQYKNEVLLVKASSKHKIVKSMNIMSFFNLTSADLPTLILLGDNPFSEDDVNKYIIKKSEVERKVQKLLEEQKSNNVTNPNMYVEKDLMNKKIAENFLENYKKGKLYKKVFSEDDYELKMTGDNFIPAINESLDEGKEILLLICPLISKKHDRIRKRIERVFNRVHESNERNIVVDIFDPFTNEISFINYKYLPTLAFIQKNKDQLSENKWIVTLHESGFTTKEMVDFIGQHTRFDFKVGLVDDADNIHNVEQSQPLYPVYKTRFEGKYLSDNLVKYNIGLKRRWQNIKKFGIVKTDFSQYETGNEFNEDYEADQFDEFDEKTYSVKDDF